MEKDVALWAIGLLCSFIGALLLILLNRILRQGDDTNKKVGEVAADVGKQSVSVAEIRTTLHGENGLVARVNRMHDERNREQARLLQNSVMENAELRTQLEELRRAGAGGAHA